MSPQVVAAIIAASVSFLTLIGTLAAQFFGRRATVRDTEKTLAEQGKHLDRTLAEQREHLDRTLAEQRTRTLNERFATAAEQLGSDKPPAVRLAGVYAMAGLADDWDQHRQTCVDVLCAYLRMPYEPDPGDGAPVEKQLDFRASQEVRHTIIRVITAHLKEGVAASWQGLDFDFRQVIFDGGDFVEAAFSGGTVNFGGAIFASGLVSFSNAKFSGSTVSFFNAEFADGRVHFLETEFSGGMVLFSFAKFSGSTIAFFGASFSGSDVRFDVAKFSGAQVSFGRAEFSDGLVDFGGAKFSGGTVDFINAAFTGGTLDFTRPGDWTCPPKFPWTGTPPQGVLLRENEDQSQEPA